MTAEEIYNKLVPIVKKYLPEDTAEENITRNSDLTRELNINSAYLVDIVLDVEDTFNVEFANEDMEQLQTIENAIAIIQKKIAS